ncbi:MAG: hypothetical protein Q9227_006293 [Pyrenula ochraceoflavens]
MASPGTPRKIVIIGGGAIGCSSAYFLTRHAFYNSQIHSVTILEASLIAGGASGTSGGLLAEWATPKCLAPLSFKLHGDLAEKHGGEKLWGYRKVYCAEVDLQAQNVDASGIQTSSEKVNNGKSTHPSSLDWLLPGSLKSYKEIGNHNNTAQVDSCLYTTHLAQFAVEGGAKIIKGRATKINYSADLKRVVSVTYCAEGNTTDLEASDVLIAAGPWTPKIFPRAALLTPRGHSVVVQPSRNLSPHILFPHIKPAPGDTCDHLISPEIYPRPPDALLDFETAYSSGPDNYEVALPPSTEEVWVDYQRCEDVWNALKSVSQPIHDGKVIMRRACYKPQIRQHEDGEEVGPMVGPTGIEGLWIATGHDEWGMQNSAGTGLVISEMIVEGNAKSTDCEPLDPKHFLKGEALAT